MDGLFHLHTPFPALCQSAVPRRKKGTGKKNNKFKRHNDHLDDVLKDYSEMTNKT